MTEAKRYDLIKKICEQKESIAYAQLPTTEEDLQDEISRLHTSIEPRSPQQDSDQWQNQLLQDLIFGTS
tara:strand:+ start:251 stop:457 length:207 start_codon:yes stop_codon:yes gene_type:complete